MAKPTVEPVLEDNLPEFAAFLAENMPAKRSKSDWITGLKTAWAGGRPNYGFLMKDDGKVVGGIGAYYAERLIRGKVEKFCNITSWCVLDSHRKFSMQLAMHVVKQEGYHFTDFSPTKVVAGVLQFLKFSPLEEAVAVIPNLPLPSFSGRVIDDPVQIEKLLDTAQLAIWRDHVQFPWLKHLVFGRPGQWCYLVYKKGSFKGFPSARIIYVGDSGIFGQYCSALTWYFFRRGVLSTHVEQRMLKTLPRLARVRTGFNPKQYLSASLSASDIDYLYSESVALDL
ncbi:hypothetical protein [uncultured Dechloromonas sp.]|uniref:hypothetical protein n=1 Tax=uncultured Dechloromonas sp. TaxID=171719 RepID=UPI0025ED5B48|nr:hypothetical protein [uncultured Dechloromonas sp.]